MDYTVGVFVEEGNKQKAILEAQQVLSNIAEKYQCRFELKEMAGSNRVNGKTVIAEHLESKAKSTENGGLSFGGEIDL